MPDDQHKKERMPVGVIITAIVTIGALEGLALYRGIDGQFFALVIAAIAALGGVKIGEMIGRKS